LLAPKSVLVIIPTYNEADNIGSLIPEIWQARPETHILVVDDNSQDGTAKIVKDLLETSGGRLHIMERQGKLGLGTAYVAGFKWALEHNYDAVIEMDADFSHDPKILPALVTQLGKTPVAIGSRYIPGGGTKNWSFFRQLISKFGSIYARAILGMRVRDLTGGFNAWRAEVLRSLDLDGIKSEGYSFQIELKYRAHEKNFEICEIPILFEDRRAGQSKMSGRIIIEAMIRVWGIRFSKSRTGCESSVCRHNNH